MAVTRGFLLRLHLFDDRADAVQAGRLGRGEGTARRPANEEDRRLESIDDDDRGHDPTDGQKDHDCADDGQSLLPRLPARLCHEADRCDGGHNPTGPRYRDNGFRRPGHGVTSGRGLRDT